MPSPRRWRTSSSADQAHRKGLVSKYELSETSSGHSAALGGLGRPLAAHQREAAGRGAGLLVRHPVPERAEVLHRREVEEVAHPRGVETGVLLDLAPEAGVLVPLLEEQAPEGVEAQLHVALQDVGDGVAAPQRPPYPLEVRLGRLALRLQRCPRSLAALQPALQRIEGALAD